MIVPVAGLLVADKYLLQRPLARGGMGSVWIASHKDLDVQVAVKFITDNVNASQETRARFEREARAAAGLESRHIVQIRDYGVVDDTPYLAMELLKGESLHQRLVERKRLSPQEASDLVSQIGRGLKRAHAAGVVHRDLKPANIFITCIDDEEVVKILDFGIAKTALQSTAADPSATQTGVMMGSVHYASPEQLRSSRTADHRSDIWSVGVILFRALTGQLPFRGEDMADIIVKVCTEPIPSACAIAPEVPRGADAFFARALARKPDERYQTIHDLVVAFQRLVAPSTRSSTTSSDSWDFAPGAPATGSLADLKKTLPLIFPGGAQKVAPPPPRASEPNAVSEPVPTPVMKPASPQEPAAAPKPGPEEAAEGKVGSGEVAGPRPGFQVRTDPFTQATPVFPVADPVSTTTTGVAWRSSVEAESGKPPLATARKKRTVPLGVAVVLTCFAVGGLGWFGRRLWAEPPASQAAAGAGVSTSSVPLIPSVRTETSSRPAAAMQEPSLADPTGSASARPTAAPSRGPSASPSAGPSTRPSSAPAASVQKPGQTQPRARKPTDDVDLP